MDKHRLGGVFFTHYYNVKTDFWYNCLFENMFCLICLIVQINLFD